VVESSEHFDSEVQYDMNALKISVLLDGVTFPPAEHELELPVFDQVLIEVPLAPKGGYTLGSDIVLQAKGLPSCDKAIVRIRGTDKNSVNVVGHVSETFDGISVHLPGAAECLSNILCFLCFEFYSFKLLLFSFSDSLAGITPDVKNKKENWYFLDVSIDESHFDESHESILFIK
jgi:hypothetical protein